MCAYVCVYQTPYIFSNTWWDVFVLHTHKILSHMERSQAIIKETFNPAKCAELHLFVHLY